MTVPNEALANFDTAQPATEGSIVQAERAIGCSLPADYRGFLLKHNGGEGFIGEHYLILWPIEDLLRLNAAYEVPERAPGLLVFGSSGGGDAFAFDTRTAPYRVLQVAFVGMSLEDAYVVADGFSGLLERMVKIHGALF